MIDEVKFIHKISPYLERFKEHGGGKFNFKCPICNDGSTGFKTRAWFLPDDVYVFYCHNCSASMSFGSFLNLKFPEVYKEYVFEKLKGNDKNSSSIVKFVQKKNINYIPHNIIKSLIKPCKDYNDVIKYLESRKIPSSHFKDIYVIEDFSELKTIDKYKSSNFLKERRLVLLNYNNEKLINGIISRALSSNSEKRYINLKFYDNPDIFNLYDELGNYKINVNKTIYVVEGAFDSMFIDNCIAVNNANLLRIKKSFTDKMLKHLEFVFIPDNDKRNKEIISIYEKIIDANEKIVIFPDYIKGKDINEIILKNKDIDISKLINENIYKGLTAKIKMNNWKKL